MGMEDHEHTHDGPVIKLDGSLGVGTVALLTVITKDDSGLGEPKETTYEVPYSLVDQDNLQKFTSLNFILGYRIVKKPGTGELPNYEGL